MDLPNVDFQKATTKFRDRTDAGRALAAQLGRYAKTRPLVLALPRGGVPVAYEVAKALRAPLDFWVVRKIGVPWQAELAMGALAEGGFIYLARDVVAEAGLSEAQVTRIIEAKRTELEERVQH